MNAGAEEAIILFSSLAEFDKMRTGLSYRCFALSKDLEWTVQIPNEMQGSIHCMLALPASGWLDSVPNSDASLPIYAADAPRLKWRAKTTEIYSPYARHNSVVLHYSMFQGYDAFYITMQHCLGFSGRDSRYDSAS